LSWTDVEAIVRIADAEPDPELRTVARDTLAWLPLDEATGRRVLSVLEDEAPQAWCEALEHHLWLLSQESAERPEMDRPDDAMTAIVLLPDHLFDEEDVVDLSVLRGLPDVPAQWLLTNLLRRLFAASADDPAVDVAVARIQRIIDVLPDSACADLILEPGMDRHGLAGAALAVARPAAVLGALSPWLRSHTPADRLGALRTLQAAARFLGQPHLFGTSTPGPREALAALAELLRREPGTEPAVEPPKPHPVAPGPPGPAAPPPPPPDSAGPDPAGPPADLGDEPGEVGDETRLDEVAGVPTSSPPEPAGATPPPPPPMPPPPPPPVPQEVDPPLRRYGEPPQPPAPGRSQGSGKTRWWWPFRRKRKEVSDTEPNPVQQAWNPYAGFDPLDRIGERGHIEHPGDAESTQEQAG
jgi:hypothetical protein